MIRQQGFDPSRVQSPESVWPVFWAFLEIDIDGLVSADGPEDRFEVSWDRPAWSDGLPSLSFCRHLTVDTSANREGYAAAEQWKLSLDMAFSEHAAFADIGALNTQSSGIYCVRLDSETDEVLAEALWEVEHYPALRALWRSTPLWSTVSFGRSGMRTRSVDTFDAQQMAAYNEWRAEHG